MSGTNTKYLEYKRMISRIQAIDTYFKNQITIANTIEDDLFTTIAHHTMLEALKEIRKAYVNIYENEE